MLDSRAAKGAVKGVIFNIQKFSVHDGHGIRSTVFFKGCPLGCRWCSNPESQAAGRDYSRATARCRACGACVARCPEGALSRAEDGRIVRDAQKCVMCGECARACPQEAISLVGRETTVAEVLAETALDGVFYRENGGLTISGGEPLLQPAFAAALCELAQRQGMTTAMESSFAAPLENALLVCRHLDQLMTDIKHMDSERHREATGLGNARILANIAEVRRRFPALDMLVRCPVIPGFNDDEAHVEKLARFVGALPGARLELLAYHRLGEGKYANLGRPYPLAGVAPLPKERMTELRSLAAAFAPPPAQE